MLIERDELLQLLGLQGTLKPGSILRYVLPGSGRRARVAWGADGLLSADVTEDIDGEDAVSVVALEGRYRDADDAFDASGLDGSGESGDPRDPRSVAVAWRRMVRPMECLA